MFSNKNKLKTLFQKMLQIKLNIEDAGKNIKLNIKQNMKQKYQTIISIKLSNY